MRKEKLLKRIVAIAVMMTVIFSTIGCGSSSKKKVEDVSTEEKKIEETTSSEKIQGGTLTTMIQTEPDSLDPYIAVAADTTSLLYNVYDGLMVLLEDGTMGYDLAKTHTVSEDGLTYTFEIKDTACFSNGNPVTIEDVVYSYKKYMTASSMFANVESVSSEGNNVIFKLKEADASFISLLIYGVTPADDSIDLNVTPIGSGPYMITSYTPGSEIVFEKNPYYNTSTERVPNLDKIIVKVNMSDTSVTLNQLMAGDLDLCQFMDPATVETVEAAGYQVVAAPSNTVQILAMNHKFEPFSDVKVRQAVNYAIDKDQILSALFYGTSEKLDSHMSPAMSTYYADDLENTYDYDVEKAKELLKEAGYEDGFSFTIKVPAAYKRHVDTALMIADMLAKVNITVNVEQIEWATWLEDVYANREYEGTVIGIAGKPDPDTVMKIYTSDYSRNFYNYFNPSYDELIVSGKNQTDESARVEIYKKCQQMLVDDAVCVYISDPANVKFAKSTVGGIKNYAAYFIDMSALYLTAE